MSLEHAVAFALLAFAIIVVPGPSVLFVVGRALAVGRRAALATVLGNAAGEYLQLTLVAFGLGLVVERSELAFSVVKLLGAGYLVWLGVQTLRRGGRALEVAGPVPAVPAPGVAARAAREGFIVGATNPKTTVFFAAVLPQFVQPGAQPVALQMLVLGLLFVAIALVSDSLWALAAGTARTWLARSRRRRQALDVGSGSVMIGLGIALALSRRH